LQAFQLPDRCVIGHEDGRTRQQEEQACPRGIGGDREVAPQQFDDEANEKSAVLQKLDS